MLEFRPSAVAAASVAALLAGCFVTATAARATPTAVAPTNDLTLSTNTPTLTWTLPAGEHSQGVTISSSDKLLADGSLAGGDVGTCPEVQRGAAWTCRTAALPAGRYWWQAASSSETIDNGETMYSSPSSFTIAPYIKAVRLSLRSYPASNVIRLITRWSTDIGSSTDRLTYALYRGRRLVATQHSSDGYATYSATNSFTHWLDFGTEGVGRVTSPGERLRLVVTVAAGGHSQTASATLTVPRPR